MTRHVHIVGALRADRADLLAAHGELVSCHRFLRGPYTGVDTVVTAAVTEALTFDAELVSRHRVELLYGLPQLRDLIGSPAPTLASNGPFKERTRFFGSGMIRCMSQGIITFLVSYADARHALGLPPLSLVLDDLHEADATAQEFVEILLRRADPDQLRVWVGSDGSLTGALKVAVDTYADRTHASATRQRVSDESIDLVRAFLDSDCTGDDPAMKAAYLSCEPQHRAREHDRRAQELQRDSGTSHAAPVGALVYHHEHGSDPQGAGRLSLLAALQYCVEVGFSAAVVDIADRGRAVSDPGQYEESWSTFTSQAAAALVPLDRLDQAMTYYRELRRVSTRPKAQMLASYGIAMMYTRFLTPRDHDQAVEWQNNAITIASIMPDPRDRLIFGVFQANAMALIEMHRGNLQRGLDLIDSGIAQLDDELADDEWVLHRSQLLYNRARLLAGLGRTDEAHAGFLALVELDPYYTDYLSELAKILRRRGDLTGSIALYDRAASMAPPYPELYYNRATAFEQLGRVELALADFDYVLEMEPGDVDSRVSRVELYLTQGDLAAAEGDVRAGLLLSPHEPRLLCQQGGILLEQGQPDAALAVLDEALMLDPDYPAALVNRAVARYEQGDYPAAADDLTRALALNGPDHDLLLNRGIAHQAAGKYADAISDFTAALALSDDDGTELRRRRGACLQQLDDYAKAALGGQTEELLPI